MIPRTVMIVDDDRPFTAELAEMLEMSGFRTAVCNEGLRAARVANDLKPDVILLDIRLDHLNGEQVIKDLRSQQTTKGTPVILMSSVSIRLISGFYEYYGIRSFLAKPFQPLDVIARIERAIPGR